MLMTGMLAQVKDRAIVAERMKAHVQAADTTPPDLPVPLPGHEPRFRLLTRGAELPSDEETTTNPRAGSVRLRAAERVREAT